MNFTALKAPLNTITWSITKFLWTKGLLEMPHNWTLDFKLIYYIYYFCLLIYISTSFLRESTIAVISCKTNADWRRKKKKTNFYINTWTTALSRLCSGSWKCCDVGYLLQGSSLFLPWQHAVQSYINTMDRDEGEERKKKGKGRKNGKIDQ